MLQRGTKTAARQHWLLGLTQSDLSGGRGSGDDYYEDDEDDYKGDEGNGDVLS